MGIIALSQSGDPEAVSKEQELNVLNSDLEGFHPCISEFGVCCLYKIKHQLLLC